MKNLQKINKIGRVIKVLKTPSSNTVSLDTEGKYKKVFEKQMVKLSKDKNDFEYKGKGSLIKKLV